MVRHTAVQRELGGGRGGGPCEEDEALAAAAAVRARLAWRLGARARGGKVITTERLAPAGSGVEKDTRSEMIGMVILIVHPCAKAVRRRILVLSEPLLMLLTCHTPVRRTRRHAHDALSLYV